MTDLNISKLIDDAVLEFGNKRFLEGWNGAIDHLLKILEDEYWHHIVMVSNRLNSGRFVEAHAHGCIGCQMIKRVKEYKSESNT